MIIDHVAVRTTDLPASKTFFETLFDLVEKPRPRAIQHIPGVWLYSDDEPVVHLIAVRPYAGLSGPDRSADAIDHVGLRIEDYGDFRARLDAAGLSYHPMELPEIGERRLFVHAPGGPLLEAVYRHPLATSVDAVDDDTTGADTADLAEAERAA